jgi:anaerobic selenocysteine-containing dehydrogenase
LAEAEVVKAHVHQPQLILSRVEAQRLGVANGDNVTIYQNDTSVSLPVKVDRKAGEGIILLPRNLAGRPAEKLVGPAGLYTTVKVEKS